MIASYLIFPCTFFQNPCILSSKLTAMKTNLTCLFLATALTVVWAQSPAVSIQAAFPTSSKQPQLLENNANQGRIHKVWLNPNSMPSTATHSCSLERAGHYRLQTTAPTHWTPPLAVLKRNKNRQHLVNEQFRSAHQNLNASFLPVPAGTVWTTSLLMSPLIPPPPPPPPSQDEEETFFRNPELWPIFNGCETLPNSSEQKACSDKKVLEYVYKQIKYPTDMKDGCWEGTTLVTFTIETDGSVSNVRTFRGLHPSFDAEAERVMASMPRWTPGKMNGRAVKVQMYFPVRIRLE